MPPASSPIRHRKRKERFLDASVVGDPTANPRKRSKHGFCDSNNNNSNDDDVSHGGGGGGLWCNTRFFNESGGGGSIREIVRSSGKSEIADGDEPMTDAKNDDDDDEPVALDEKEQQRTDGTRDGYMAKDTPERPTASTVGRSNNSKKTTLAAPTTRFRGDEHPRAGYYDSTAADGRKKREETENRLYFQRLYESLL